MRRPSRRRSVRESRGVLQPGAGPISSIRPLMRGTTVCDQPDHRAHGGEPLAEWFIRKCGEYRRKNGRPLIDVFDFHWYPQCAGQWQDTLTSVKGWTSGSTNSVCVRPAICGTQNTCRNRGSRNSGPRTGPGDPPGTIAWIERHDPSMEMCLGEYNFGGGDNITGGLAQAERLRDPRPRKSRPCLHLEHPGRKQNWPGRLFRNYDGRAAVSERILASSANIAPIDRSCRPGAKDGATRWSSSTRTWAVHAISSWKRRGCAASSLCGLDQTSTRVIEADAGLASVDGKISLRLPAASASILVVQ